MTEIKYHLNNSSLSDLTEEEKSWFGDAQAGYKECIEMIKFKNDLYNIIINKSQGKND